MGFSQGAITSNKNNRNLQRKQSSFGLGKNGLNGQIFTGKKAPINESKMQKIEKRSQMIEAIFYATVLMFALGFVYYLAT